MPEQSGKNGHPVRLAVSWLSGGKNPVCCSMVKISSPALIFIRGPAAFPYIISDSSRNAFTDGQRVAIISASRMHWRLVSLAFPALICLLIFRARAFKILLVTRHLPRFGQVLSFLTIFSFILRPHVFELVHCAQNNRGCQGKPPEGRFFRTDRLKVAVNRLCEWGNPYLLPLEGTFAPFFLAFERPIAAACFLSVTFLPLRPLFRLPRLYFFIVSRTVSLLFLPYRVVFAISYSNDDLSCDHLLYDHNLCSLTEH